MPTSHFTPLPNPYLQRLNYAQPKSSTRPSLSQYNPAGLQPILRDQFSIQTWLLLGALLQVLLFALPIRRLYVVAPVVVVLGWTLIDTVLMSVGWTRNRYMDDSIQARFTALMPDEDGEFKRGDGKGSTPGGKGVTVFLLGFKVNHPLGMLAPGFKEMFNQFHDMTSDLEANTKTNGFLGASTYNNISARSTKSEIISVMYFRSLEDVENFAVSQTHRDGWNWFNRVTKKHPHLGIHHELYEAPSGRWENVYVNMQPTLLGNTSHPVEDENGNTAWASPIVDARKGRAKTSAGRLGMDTEKTA